MLLPTDAVGDRLKRRAVDRRSGAREDEIELPDGSTSVYGVVERPDFALVLPADRDGFWLVEQYRHPIGRRNWEFPQGTWSHGSDGTPEELARAEQLVKEKFSTPEWTARVP